MRLILFVGTKRGLFVAHADALRISWRFSSPRLEGREVYWAAVDTRTGKAWAATRHAVWGTHIHRSDDLGDTWTVLDATPHHADERSVTAVWQIASGPSWQPQRLYAGIEPAGLFVSEDEGRRWRPMDALNTHPTAHQWQPAGGALALHSIAVDPHVPGRVFCAVSAGGVYRSDDDGSTWMAKNDGVRADFLPVASPAAGHCVHKLLVHPAREGRLYQQNHCGVYLSDDAGDSWLEITGDLPSDFGYVLATEPNDADTLFVVPEESSHMRTTVGGRLVVYRTRNAGASWQPLIHGLPQRNAYISLLRDAMAWDRLEPAGIYFGTSSGHVFASRDAGERFQVIAEYLPRVLSVSVVVER
ncbi:MAG: WD40/YVTN/BNR-like repeat-containing protein [Longimicrobiales bacterium]